MNVMAPPQHSVVQRATGPVVGPKAFRGAMRHLAGAVSIVTVGKVGERAGLTAVSVTTLCAETPTVMVCVNLESSAWPILCRQGCFGVNVLTARHEEIADRFAGRVSASGEERYAGSRWLTLATGAPLLADALVGLDCEVEETIERHGSAIIIGRIRGIRSSESGNALLYWRGGYEALGWTEAEAQRAVGFG